MEKDLISIIVPIYNVEKYINDCIQSIIEQTYKKIEIILINDGSTDKSGEKCNKYARKDKRITVINTKNEGVSKARNIGIQEAKGKYITFIDADDYVERNYVENLYRQCIDNCADMSICGIQDVTEKKIKVKKSNKIKEILNSEEALKELLNEKYYPCVVWAKMYKKEIFKNIRFNEKTKIAEDLEIIYKLIDQCNKISVDTSKYLYNYRKRKTSVTNSKYNEAWENEIKICDQIINFIEKKYPNIKDFAIKRYIRINVSCIYKILNNKQQHDKIKKLKANINKYEKKLYVNTNFKNIIKTFIALNIIK